MTPAKSSSPGQLLSSGTEILAYVLIGQFLLIVSGSFLPPQFLDVNWQLTLAGNLVDNGAYPLLALFLIRFASFIDTDNEGLARRQRRISRLACLVAVAYLLLAPLQVAACRLGFVQASSSLRQQGQAASRAISDLRQVIQSSASSQELQSGLRRIQAPPLAADALNLPLSELKGSMLAQLEGRRTTINTNLREPLIKRLWPIFQKTMRNTLASLVLAVGFAAMAIPKNASSSLLQQWLAAVTGLGGRVSKLRRRWHEWWENRREASSKARRAADLKRIQSKGKATPLAPFARKPQIHDQDYFDAISRDPDDRRSGKRKRR